MEEIRLTDQETVLADRLRRVVLIADLCERRVRATDPLIVNVSILESLASEFGNAIVELDSFISERSASRIEQANVRMDEALIHVSRQFVPSASNELEAVLTSFSEFRVVAATEVENFKLRVTKLFTSHLW